MGAKRARVNSVRRDDASESSESDDTEPSAFRGEYVLRPQQSMPAPAAMPKPPDDHPLDDDSGMVADDEFEDDGLTPVGAFGEPTNEKRVRTKRRPLVRQIFFNQAFTALMTNTAPRGLSMSVNCTLCGKKADVFCQTCDMAASCTGNFCADCDSAAHVGPTCCPSPHRRSVLCTGRNLGATEGVARQTPDALDLELTKLDGVFLGCAAACPDCLGRSWTPSGDVDRGGLIVIDINGRTRIDRVGFACTKVGCEGRLERGDPRLYITENTRPTSLGGDCKQVICVRTLNWMHQMRSNAPGASCSAFADTLTALSNNNYPSDITPPVRPDSLRDALHLAEALAGAQDRSEGAINRTDVAQPGVSCIGSDGDQKVKLNPNRTKASIADNLDNTEPSRVLPDW